VRIVALIWYSARFEYKFATWRHYAYSTMNSLNNGPITTTWDWILPSQMRSFSALEVFGASQRNLHLRIWTMSASPAIQCSASSLTTNWRLSTTSTVCCRRVLVYCTTVRVLRSPALLRRHCMVAPWRDVFRAMIVAKIMYPSLVWVLFGSGSNGLDSFVSRCKRFGFTNNNLPSVESL